MVYKLTPDLWLDPRRALWLEGEGTLVVGDLHLGYAWAHRHDGQLLPLSPPDDTETRLASLCADYHPRRIVLLGDIVHQSVPVPALRAELVNLVGQLTRESFLTLVSGNHDRELNLLLALRGEGYEITSSTVIQRCLLVHGDNNKNLLVPEGSSWDRVVMGHEHPAVTLNDGVASWVRCPCFLVSDKLIVLPAFSNWAAGTLIGDSPFMSARARAADFTHAVAIAGKRLLPLPLKCV